jgi:hypothetical protein
VRTMVSPMQQHRTKNKLKLTRRNFGLGLLGLASSVRAAIASTPERVVTVYKTATCSCCKAWVDHIAKSGFKAKVIELDDLTEVKRRLGVPAAHESCHTALVDGYFIEGHVPAGDILRLVEGRPNARGLAVPGMPVGSPGMDIKGAKAERFQTLLIAKDGSASVFAEH